MDEDVIVGEEGMNGEEEDVGAAAAAAVDPAVARGKRCCKV